VIWEMNGSEVIENLAVIKVLSELAVLLSFANHLQVPYRSLESVESVDYPAGAALILEAIARDSLLRMLAHNREQAAKLNAAYSARKYADIFLSH
jgi:hypothetical protein